VVLPDPRPGLVIRYDYLWMREANVGQSQGKDRPTCLVAATDDTIRSRYVVLLPITHTPPTGDTVGIEIPAKVKKSLGLDDEPSWVIVSEHNIDEWPNAGLSPIPEAREKFSYGFIPPGLFAKIRSKFLEMARSKKTGTIGR